MQRFINGIQQVGIGVADANAAFEWYKDVFGTDIVVFKDTAVADLMVAYTGNTAQKRHAILALNLQGGGGFEIWQYADREPVAPLQKPALGDTGVFAVKIRCKDVNEAHQLYVKKGIHVLNHPCINPEGKKHFYLSDPWQNIFELIEDDYWFTNESSLTGAVAGVIIGVTDMENSVQFYRHVLGFTQIIYSGEAIYTDWNGVEGSDARCKRTILKRTQAPSGAFGKLLGPVLVELVQSPGSQQKKIFNNRYWGDLGFIHVCFDVTGMQEHEKICAACNYPFTVNSASSFDMGEASGHFSYNEDPDGTLIEYVETHRVPIVKKFGLYINLKKREAAKCLPNWIVKCLRFSRVK